MKLFRGMATCLLGALLSACGGGGSPNTDGKVTPQSGSSGGFSISFDRSSVSANIVEGDTSTTMMIKGTASREPDAPVYVGAVATGVGIDPRIPVSFSGLEATVNVRPAAGLTAGTHAGQIVLNACADNMCQSHYAGSPKVVTYSIKVVPKISASLSSLTFAAPEGGMASATTLSVSPVSADTATHLTLDDGGAGWLGAEVIDANTYRIAASARNLSAGTYQATVRISTMDGLQTLSVPVTLTVSNGIIVTQLSESSLDAGSMLADTAMQLPVQSASGTRFNWTASTTSPWIKIDTGAGSDGDAVNWHVDLTEANGLANFSSHEGQIRIASSSSALTPVLVRVVLNKRLPEVNVVAPFSVPSDRPSVVRVRGRGFDSINNLVDTVRVGGVTPLSVKRINDTSLQVSLPTLAVGNHAISAHRLSALTPTTHVLKSIAPKAFDYTAISTQSLFPESVALPNQFVYDPDRKSLTMVNRMTNNYYDPTWQSNLIQYRFNGSRWNLTTKLLTRVSALGMSADGLQFLTGHPWNDYSSKLTLFNADTLAQEDQVTLSIPLDSNDMPLMVTNDNRVLINEGNRHAYLSFFDLRTRQLVRYPGDQSIGTALYSYDNLRSGGISGDGEYIISGPNGTSTPMPPPIAIAASEGVVRLASTPQFYNSVGLNTDGSRVYIGFSWVLDASGNTIGNWDQTPLSAWQIVGATYSLDGKRLYTLAYSKSVVAPRGSATEPTLPASAPKPRVFIWDATRTDALGKFVPEGYFELNHYPGCRADNFSIDEPCKAQVEVTAPPDKKSLLFIGNRYFVAAPIPTTLTPF